MGLPAEKLEPRQRKETPKLRLVRGAGKAPAKRIRPAVSPAAELFRAFCLLFGLLAVLAVGRVWLSAQAAEASIASGHLRQQIKAERFAGDMLEIQASQLAAPSRVEQIAGKSLGMTAPRQVCYINVGTSAKPSHAATASPERGGTGLKGVVSSAMNLAAGEAQVLLVGDVGLASAQ